MIEAPHLWTCPACFGSGWVPAFACCGREERPACCGEPHPVEFSCECCAGAGLASGDAIRRWADAIGDRSLSAEQDAREIDAIARAGLRSDPAPRL